MTPAMPRALTAPPALLAGAGLCLLPLCAALLSLVWLPGDPGAIDVARQFIPPSPAHPFGTDHYGRDILAMVMAGAQTSIGVAAVALAIGAGLGIPLGLLAAARRGIADTVIMRGGDIVFAFPALLLAILVTAVLGPGAVNAILAIGLFNVPVFARLTRGAALAVWPREFILAARAAGKGDLRISLEHVLPNVEGVLIVQGTIQFALAVLAEAALAYVGLGAQPPTASWGRMLADAQTYVPLGPWMALFPGGAIVLTVLGLNLLGDGLRDLLDPRSRARG